MTLPLRLLVGAAIAATMVLPAHAGSAGVAVAANFTAVAEALADGFKAATGHDLVLSFGSSEQLLTQISQGAPFDVFLSADAARPAQAVAEGLGVEGSVFTYAIGRLALYSTVLDMTDGAAVLAGGDFQHIAIADPATAPYGAAAVEVIAALGLTDALAEKLVTGQNISQALQFVDTANAELGFVALSQVAGKPATQMWTVPTGLYSPIRQDAVLLTGGAANPAAIAFLDYLASDAARELIAAAGYAVE